MRGESDLNVVRRAIFDLGTQGYFCGKNLSIEKTGDELLNEIQKARLQWLESSKDQELKEALAAQRKLKKHQSLIIPDRKVPPNWSWATLLQTSQTIISVPSLDQLLELTDPPAFS